MYAFVYACMRERKGSLGPTVAVSLRMWHGVSPVPVQIWLRASPPSPVSATVMLIVFSPTCHAPSTVRLTAMHESP